jgi:ATP-dependent Clp protease protease subunit
MTVKSQENTSSTERKVFWTMKKSIGADPEILFYGEICESSWWDDEISPKQFADDLAALGDISALTVRINSPGGDLFAANAIYNILKNHSARITAYVDGLAASAATIVLMAGDEIIIPRNGMLMIHNPSTGCWGDARDHRKMADMLDTARETMLATYEARTGQTRDKLISLLNSETWLTAKDAVELGFADQIDEQVAIAASLHAEQLVVNGLSFDASKFDKIPENFAKPSSSKVPLISVSRDGDNTRFALWQPFVENGVKDDERIVFGYSTLFGVEDFDGERMTREAIEKALPAYMEDPIIDEVHNLQPVGEAPILRIDDLGLLTGAHIADDSAWGKVKNNTYKGFSLGGDVLAVRESVVDGKLVTDLIEVRIDAISLCDRPKCPGAVYQLVTNQGGSLVLCIKEGGEKNVAETTTETQTTEEQKTTFQSFLAWLKGEGKDEMTAALGIDMSAYATKEDLAGIVNSVSGVSTKLDEFMAKLDQAGAAAGAGEDAAAKAAAEAAAAASNSGDGSDVIAKFAEQFGTAMTSMTDALKDVVARVDTIEASKGMRKSVDALGGPKEGEGIFDSLFPAEMAGAVE